MKNIMYNRKKSNKPNHIFYNLFTQTNNHQLYYHKTIKPIVPLVLLYVILSNMPTIRTPTSYLIRRNSAIALQPRNKIKAYIH